MTLAYLALAWLLGVGVMAATGEPWAVGAAAALAFAAWLAARRSWRALPWAMLAAALLGGGARLSVLHPPPEPLAGADEDENGVVLKLTLGEASFLLTADLGAKGETYLTNRHADLQATVLKVAHHGSAGSTSPAFLAAVQPLTVVVTVGRDNRFGLPSPETLGRLEPRPVFRTDVHGDIEISTDGGRLWIETERSRE